MFPLIGEFKFVFFFNSKCFLVVHPYQDIYIYILVHIYIYTHVCVYIYIYTHACVYIYINRYMYNIHSLCYDKCILMTCCSCLILSVWHSTFSRSEWRDVSLRNGNYIDLSVFSTPEQGNLMQFLDLILSLSLQSMDWFKGKSESESVDFPLKYVGFGLTCSLQAIHCFNHETALIFTLCWTDLQCGAPKL